MSLLRLRDVAKFYGRKLVLRGVSLEMQAGQVVLVAGRNGAGKSTLLKVMAGLSRPTAGTVERLADPARTAYLGHATFIYPRLTARQNLAFWARMYGLVPGPEMLQSALRRVGLERAADERAGSFSRGMAQRLNLARVFLVDPELVFLDEPGTGLDSDSQSLLRREIEAFRRNGAAVVWVSHQVAEDAALADRVLVVADGRAGWSDPVVAAGNGAPSC